MFYSSVLGVTLLLFQFSVLITGSFSLNVSRNFVYKIYHYEEMVTVVLDNRTELFLDFMESSEEYHAFPTRVHVSSNDTDDDHPVFVTATQQKSVSSWELPLVVQRGADTLKLNSMARTLCPHDAGPNITTVNRPTVQVTTSSPKNVSVELRLRRVKDFFIEVDKEVYLNVTPATPKYYYFSFDTNPWNVSEHGGSLQGYLPKFNYTIPKSVILIIESDDHICAAVSIQNNSCPVFQSERDILYQGYHLTMMNKGGITLTQSMFPVGFYVVFIVKDKDEDCTGLPETDDSDEPAPTASRHKNFRFRIVATISYKQYALAAMLVLLLMLLLVSFVLLVSYVRCQCTTVEVVIIEDEAGPSTANLIDDSPTNADVKQTDDSDAEVEATSSMPALTVARLSRTQHAALARRADRYFWSVCTVAVVYALPVVQLLAMYQRMVFQTGAQDLCYYNFLCAHPLGQLSDVNHVYSNICYVLLGIVFMIQTARRRECLPGMGIGSHKGLYHSMGLALAMEGLLSACYHLCPNKMNFQFDSSFMYVIAILVMIKLYQNRHPDVNASAHTTTLLIAVIMSIGVFGIMYPSVYFWVLFTILHLVACLTLTLQIYYVGRFKFERGVFPRAYRHVRQHGRRAFLPAYTARAALLAVINLANWALAAHGLYEHNKDLARHLLAVLMGNALLYTFGYLTMKILHRERLLAHTWIYLVLSIACCTTALIFFLDSRTKWSETPAQSRLRNAQCSVLEFFDSHDVWHVTSAAGMFLYFNALMTFDDALHDTPRKQIPVF